MTKFNKAFIIPVVLVKWLRQADIAHLVERNLAKVEVASSSLVVRSNFFDSKLVTGWTRSSVGQSVRLITDWS